MPQPDLRKLRDMPVSNLTLDDTKITDLAGLRGLHLDTLSSLSIGHTSIQDLTPLAGMPLRNLNIENTLVVDLTALQGLPPRNAAPRRDPRGRSPPAHRYQTRTTLARRLPHDSRSHATARAPAANAWIDRTGVTDLQPLTQSPLRELNLEGCANLI